MREDGLTEHAARNREAWAQRSCRLRCRRRAELGDGGDHVGDARRARARARDARRRRGPRRGRARLRDGIRLGLARPARRARRRRRPDARAARHGAPAAGAARALVPARRGERGGRAAAGRVVRPRRLRVRREHLVRPRSVGGRGGAAPPPGRRARVPRQRDAADAHLSRRGSCRSRRRGAPAAVFRNAPLRMGRRRSASTSTSATATGSGCSAATASRSSGWSSCGTRGGTRDATSSSRPSGRERWPAEEMWKARKT